MEQNAYAEDVQTILDYFSVDQKMGLSDEQVEKQRRKYGKNEIPKPPGSSFVTLVIKQFNDTLVLILLGAAIVSFVLALFEASDDRITAFVEPLVILTILICNATVGVIQESNAEAAIEKLRESEARDATVVRNGQTAVVHASELVPGDIISVQVGDKVPADSRIISLSSAMLSTDEAMLTGESEAANKHADAIRKKDAVNQDKRNILFSGTLVVRGKGTAVVVHTGAKTAMGEIAITLHSEDETKTPLQQKLDEFGEQLSKVISLICVVVWLINIGHFTDPVHGSWVRGAIYYFKIAVALAVAAIPEGLPAVVTTCLALGTLKMAKKKAIVRSLPSVETLGCTTVICSDKTGTLTTNKMTVHKVLSIANADQKNINFNEYEVEGDSFSPLGQIIPLVNNTKQKSLSHPADDLCLADIAKISALCNESTLHFEGDEKTGIYSKSGAPTEAAMLVLAEKIGVPDINLNRTILNSNDPHYRCSAARHYWEKLFTRETVLEFSRERKSMSVLVKNGKDTFLFCKGAPESVLKRCTHVARGGKGDSVQLSNEHRTKIENYINQYATEGLRVLGLSYIKNPSFDQHDMKNIDDYEKIESGMTFVGLTALMDPPRPQVKEAISKCRRAGIRVIVITGDNQITAESICRRIGVFGPKENLNDGQSFTGSEFSNLTEAKKEEAVKNASLFSRVEPRHKLDIVTLLKKQQEVVAMTGDGVNDATALRKADIGVAMGSGTDVAREASDMVLQDDNFATIVMAVEEGRAIYANTKQFIRYLISSNIGEVACIFLTAAIGMPEALIPVQLLWVNLVTDGLPATALGFNPPDKDIMLQSPRGREESIVNGWMFFRYLAIGLYVGVGTIFGFIWWYLYSVSGPQISWAQLTNFHDCQRGSNVELFKGIDCSIFHDARPSTVSLSVLVTIEMFNALNALSENQSLLVVPPWSNVWVLLACTLSMLLHFMVVYVPFFSRIFHLAPLSTGEWGAVIWISLPVLLLDEVLKLVSRNVAARSRGDDRKKNH